MADTNKELKRLKEYIRDLAIKYPLVSYSMVLSFILLLFFMLLKSYDTRMLALETKWILISALPVFIALLIGGYIKSFKGFGVEIETKTINSSLGRTEVSAVSVKSSNLSLVVLEGFQKTYVGDNFLISWPADTWDMSINVNQDFPALQNFVNSDTRKIPILIRRIDFQGLHQPNVNVMVELVGDITIDDYMNLTLQQAQANGLQIIFKNTDEDTQAGFIEYKSLNEDMPYLWFARIALMTGRAYVVTATVNPSGVNEGLLGQALIELKSIVNSFRFIK